MQRKSLIFHLAISFLMTSLLIFSGCAKKVKIVSKEEAKGLTTEEAALEGKEGAETAGAEGGVGDRTGIDVGEIIKGAIEDITDLPSRTGMKEEDIEMKISRLDKEGLEDRKSFGTVAGEVAGEGGLLPVLFDFDSYNIRGDSRETLKRNARWLRDNPTARIIIEGHADERGSSEYNLALGERRARSTREYLKNLGLEDRFKTISYGEENPACVEHHEACWSRNRRANFVIISE